MPLVWAIAAWALGWGAFKWHEVGFDFVASLCLTACVICMMAAADLSGDKK